MHNKWQGDSFNVRNQKAKIQGYSKAWKTKAAAKVSLIVFLWRNYNNGLFTCIFEESGNDAQCSAGSSKTGTLSNKLFFSCSHLSTHTCCWWCCYNPRRTKWLLCAFRIKVNLIRPPGRHDLEVVTKETRWCNLSLMCVCAPNLFFSQPL